MRPQACCADDPKCPTSPIAHTDFSTRYGDVAITRIRVLIPNYLCHITVSCVYATLKPPQKCNCHARTGIDIREMLAKKPNAYRTRPQYTGMASGVFWTTSKHKLILIHSSYNTSQVDLFCSLAVLDPRVGHTMDVLSPSRSLEHKFFFDPHPLQVRLKTVDRCCTNC